MIYNDAHKKAKNWFRRFRNFQNRKIIRPRPGRLLATLLYLDHFLYTEFNVETQQER